MDRLLGAIETADLEVRLYSWLGEGRFTVGFLYDLSSVSSSCLELHLQGSYYSALSRAFHEVIRKILGISRMNLVAM